MADTDWTDGGRNGRGRDDRPSDPAGPDRSWASARRVTSLASSRNGKPQGVTGTLNSGGYIQGIERNKALSQWDVLGTPWRPGVWASMEREDPQIAGLLRSMGSVIMAAPWRIEPPQDADDDDLRAVDLLTESLESMEGGWRGFLRHALTFVSRGFALFEEIHWRRPDGLIGLRELAPRLQTTVRRWLVGDDDRLDEVEFQAPQGQHGALRTYRLPSSVLTLLVFDMEGANYLGRSILRPVYTHWQLKRQVIKATAIDVERAGSGFLEFRQTEQAADVTDQDVATFHETALNWRNNEFAHAVLPWGVEMSFTFPDVPFDKRVAFLSYLDREISKSFLQTFLELGMDSAGTQALGTTLTEHFLLSLRAVTGQIEDALNATGGTTVSGPLARLVEMNFGRRLRWPRLRFGDLNPQAADAALRTIASGLPLGMFGSWSRSDMDRARTLADLDPLPSGDGGGGPAPSSGGGGVGQDVPEPETDDAPDVAEPPAAMSHRPGEILVMDAIGVMIPSHRALLPGERAVAYSEIRSMLDKGDADIESVAKPVLDRAARRMTRDILTELNADDADTRLAAVAEVSIGQTERRALRDAVLPVLTALGAAAGASAVRETVRAARAGRRAEGERKVRATPLADVARPDVAVVARAHATAMAEAMVDDIQAAVRAAGLRAAASGSRRALDDAAEAATTRSSGWYRRMASAATGATTSAARLDGALGALDELGVREVAAVMYSSVLDGATCGPCAQEDGNEFALGSEEFWRTRPPFAQCDGRDACRCIHVLLG